MRKPMILSVAMALALAAAADTWSDPETGIAWTYTVGDGMASIGVGSSSGTAVSTSTSGDLTIPSTLGGCPVTSIGNYAFSYCRRITGIKIPEGVASIGDYAFNECSGLTSVVMPGSVTRIGEYAFSCCVGLTSVLMPDSVTSIGMFAFAVCDGLTSVTIPNGVMRVENCVFYYCRGLASVTIPDSVYWIGSQAFYHCTGLKSVRFLGAPPMGINSCNELISGESVVYYPREYGAAMRSYFGLSRFGGYMPGEPAKIMIVSSTIRENDPTIMDVVYKVTSSKPTVKVRALAFEDGERSFAKVVRPETFIEGTAANVGDEIAANVEHTITWQVSSDWQTRLAKLKFEVLASEGGILPMEWMTIPASDQYGKIKVSWNTQWDHPVFDALLWLYADKDVGLSLSNGILRNGSTQLANGAVATNPNAIQYIYSKLGCSLLAGDVLNYVNDETRLGLSPSGVRQYAYKIVGDAQ